MNLNLLRSKMTMLLVLMATVALSSFGQQSTSTLKAAEDVGISQQDPTKNFNGITDMGVAIDETNNDGRQAYVKFDISDLTGKGGLVSASLSIMASVKNEAPWHPIDNFKLDVYGCPYEWSEKTLTWESMIDLEASNGPLSLIGQGDIQQTQRYILSGTYADTTLIRKHIEEAMKNHLQFISFVLKGRDETAGARIWVSDMNWEVPKLLVLQDLMIDEPGGTEVYVETITITGADNAKSITVDNGTLQMISTALPANASIQRVKWAVTNGTGKATISETGLLTAITNGTVTVKAEAIDGSFTQGMVDVTISGQKIAVGELSVVKDGFFAVNGANHPNWSGNAVIEDGVAVCDPPAGGAFPWDWTMTQQVNVPYEDKDKPYIFTFKAWADEVRTFNVDFEDPNNGYKRYGVSPEGTDGGTSDWTFDVTTEPTTYVFHVTFSNMDQNAKQMLQFMLGKADAKVYIDSVMLTKESDLLLSSKNMQANVLRVYPNPVGAAHELSVSLSSAQGNVAIYNALGQKLMEKIATTNVVKFNISSLRTGMYIVRLSDGTSQKFIK